MELIVFALLCGALGGVVGYRKGEVVPATILSLLFGPLGIAIAALSNGSRTPCPHCRESMRVDANLCPHCRSPVSPAVARWNLTSRISGGVVLAVLASVCLAWWAFARIISRPVAPTAYAAPVTPYVAPVAPAPAVSPEDVMRAEKARFAEGQAAIKKNKPKTEAEVEFALGAKPDSCIDTGTDVLCHWYYATKPIGRDVIAVTYRGGRVALTLY